jgi:hypothetical protein
MLRRLYLAYLPQYVPPIEVAVNTRISGVYNNATSTNSTDKRRHSIMSGKSAAGERSRC